ncbi:cob(I)yrinic acid a,c-diamide adenosyltransferase [Candidatus Micrarchaeota archaeon]|nr:cob(I)yrinic acid a,c-diamide adenosyltransferase [Candidatus Micrarchaeota archaeon]
MKIYTRAGDKGETSIFGGKIVRKESTRVEAYGTVDELNTFVGLARAYNNDTEMETILKEVQSELFTLGADLATPLENDNIRRISNKHTKDMESIIDRLNEKLDPLHNFILPTGNIPAATFQVCRTVCRRSERRVTALAKEEQINLEIIPYLNRLSTLFFVLARTENKRKNIKEEIWQQR